MRILIIKLRRLLQSFFHRKNIIVMTPSSTESLKDFFGLIRPIKTNYELVRLGGDNDGGYLVPNCLDDIKLCISPGVGEIAKFEEEIYEKHGISSILLDHTIQEPNFNKFDYKFINKKLSYDQKENSVNLDELVQENSMQENDLILQMDIEGHEYEILLNAQDKTLRSFRIMIIEFHDLYYLRQQYSFKFIYLIFQKLLRYFEIVHIHPNNAGEKFSHHGDIFPSIIELTFLRKDFADNLGYSNLPHNLDQPNLEKMEDFFLPKIY